MTDIEKFKSLLEYFISHVDWKQNMDKTHVGFSKYIKPLLDNNSFVESGQGYNGNKIQKLIGDWETINNHKIYLNIQPNYGDWSTRKCYLNWGNTGINIFCNWDKTKNVQGVDIGYAYWWETPVQYKTLLTKTIKELDLFNNGVSSELQKFYNFFVNEIINYDKKCGYYYQKEIENKYKMFTNILTSNRNLILTGAPGTGKTYLAKQIAKSMGCTDNEIGFVQFHPSYDYTDFVEGLRPAQNKSGNVGFVRKDGVFKAFCRKALKNVIDSKKTPQELKNEKTFKEKYDEIIGKIENGEIDRFDLRTGVQMDVVEVSEKDNIILRTHGSDKQYTVSFGRLSQLAKKFPDVASLNSITNIDKTIRDVIKGCHTSSYWAVLKAIYEQCSSDENEIVPNEVEEKKYVFIIDEINRGEISKIFGELFFSIDPGYRGIEGKVRTQYANMQTDPNVFDEALGINDSYNCGHFFVPENVYIIGTMNDIDRSVESMDFAFRRRFAFKEIKAMDRVEMLYDSNNGIGNFADEAKERMNRLNMEIEIIEGLSTAYHIGPAYFLKLKNYNGDFQQLWENHLEGLLREYLRGMQNVDEKMKILKAAYDNESNSNN
ncbi:MAG: AAA family ATPase [Bacteroidales bacterium]|nr:AAA family ATPase [Bacteroidales bacterium]